MHIHKSAVKNQHKLCLHLACNTVHVSQRKKRIFFWQREFRFLSKILRHRTNQRDSTWRWVTVEACYPCFYTCTLLQPQAARGFISHFLSSLTSVSLRFFTPLKRKKKMILKSNHRLHQTVFSTAFLQIKVNEIFTSTMRRKTWIEQLNKMRIKKRIEFWFIVGANAKV